MRSSPRVTAWLAGRGRPRSLAGGWLFYEDAFSPGTSNVEEYIENAVHWNDIIVVDELGQLLGACVLHVVD